MGKTWTDFVLLDSLTGGNTLIKRFHHFDGGFKSLDVCQAYKNRSISLGKPTDFFGTRLVFRETQAIWVLKKYHRSQL